MPPENLLTANPKPVNQELPENRWSFPFLVFSVGSSPWICLKVFSRPGFLGRIVSLDLEVTLMSSWSLDREHSNA